MKPHKLLLAADQECQLATCRNMCYRTTVIAVAVAATAVVPAAAAAAAEKSAREVTRREKDGLHTVRVMSTVRDESLF